MTHRYAALTVAFGIGLTLWHLLRAGSGNRGIRPIAWTLIILLTIQGGLGITNVLFAIPMWSRILHLGTAATIWTVMVILSVVLYHAGYQSIKTHPI